MHFWPIFPAVLAACPILPARHPSSRSPETCPAILSTGHHNPSPFLSLMGRLFTTSLLPSLAVWSHRVFSRLCPWCWTCGPSGYRQWCWWSPWKFKPQPRLQSQYARLSYSLASGPHYPVTEWTKLSLDVEDFYGALTLSTIVMAHEINSSQFKARWNHFCQNYAHWSLEQMNKKTIKMSNYLADFQAGSLPKHLIKISLHFHHD